MLFFHLARTTGGLSAMLALAVVLGVAKTHPAGALEVTLEVTEHTTDPHTTGPPIMNAVPGQPLDLIARSNEDVNPPLRFQVYEVFVNSLVGHCEKDAPAGGNTCVDAPDHCTACKVPVTQTALTPPPNAAYAAYVAETSNFLPPPNVPHSDDVFPSWLNPLKLYAYRDPNNLFVVELQTDREGVSIVAPWTIEFFKVSCSPGCFNSFRAGDRLTVNCGSFPASFPTCTVRDIEPSAATYQAILSRGGPNVNTARSNDARVASYFKCVDSNDVSSAPSCVIEKDPITGQ